MADPQNHILPRLYGAMAEPGFYPHPVRRIQRIETHISVVFLTGDLVYKLKKPVDMGFLDFCDLARRRHFCEQEVLLNRRLSDGVYLDVVPIFALTGGAFSLAGPGEVVEFAVRMRQLPQAAGFVGRIRTRKMNPALIRKLGQRLAAFYDRSPGGPEIDRYGTRDVISVNMEENFAQIAPFAGTGVDPERWRFVQEVSRAFLRDREALFDGRIAAGRIRDGHGDLRTEHVYFYRGIQIIDCIEFNDRFRYGDAVADIAFLYMDLARQGLPTWGLSFLRAYVAASGDRQAYALVDFYAVYRAVVRLKIACFQRADAATDDAAGLLDSDIRLYLDQAYRYALAFGRPTLWITCGLPASGKSAQADGISRAMSIEVIRSDAVRREMFDPADAAVIPFGRRRYRPGMRGRVYARMLAMAQERIRSGASVLLDATFSLRKWRQAARLLARDLDANLVCVECRCRERTLRRRLGTRKDESGLSDARPEHLDEMMAVFEPLDDLPRNTHVRVDTERGFHESLDAVLGRAHALRHDQINARL